MIQVISRKYSVMPVSLGSVTTPTGTPAKPAATAEPNNPMLNSRLDDREVASHGESTAYETVDEKREINASLSADAPIALSPMKKSSLRSSTLRKHRRSDSSNLYELSADLREKTIECLENKYGGKWRANQSARTIQQCYRHWIMNKSFMRMRAYSGRKRSLTMPGKHFEKLKKTSFVFYGPENPIMIVDGEQDKKNSIEQNRMISEVESPKITNIVDLAKDHLCSQSTDSEDSDTKGDDVTSRLDENHFAEALPEEKDIVDAAITHDLVVPVVPVVPVEEKVPLKNTISRSSSNNSSQYDIIDDSNVITVEGKHVDLEDGSSFEVDKIYELDATDGLSLNVECLQDTSQKYEPTFDKSTQKRQFRIGVNLFNWKAEVGIQYLIDNGHLQADVKSIAEFLRKETTISKQKISEYFSNLRNKFNNRVLLEFAKSFHFVDKEVDEALRQFQSYFKLTGEAQTVEKFLQVFAERYVECNPGKISDNPDTILLLAFALAMLNTDLHNQNVKRRMTPDEFLRNLRGTDNGNDLNQDMLRSIYYRIQKNEFATGADHTTQLHQIENSFIGKVPNLAATHRQFVKLYTVEEVNDPNRKEKPHNRLAFLFNDLLLLAKPRGKSSGHVFTCKASYSLLGKRVAEFSNEQYPFGVLLLGKLDNKAVATFNTKDERTKKSLAEELDEYIRETNGMENIRIALSKAQQLTWHNYRRNDDGRTKSLLLSKDNNVETQSLIDLRLGNSLEAEDVQSNINNGASMVGSVSMGDINEVGTDEESDYDKMVRTNSATSLDPVLLTASFMTIFSTNAHKHSQNKQYEHANVNENMTSNSNQKGLSPRRQQLHSLPRTVNMKRHTSIFGTWGPKLRKSATSSSGSNERRQHWPSLPEEQAKSSLATNKREKSPSPPIRCEKSPSLLEGKTSPSWTEKRKSLPEGI